MLKIQNSLRTSTGDYLYERLVDLGLIKKSLKFILSEKTLGELNVFF
jgi:hypothetical protein